ncbi:toll/interleukin-1 receptor domain-containing protein [Rhodopirellula sp. JC639]|uniref:toll/interleukin-1 receptor domain-containing protein n=1 Tax=Stieleria mannarensis TaxID=2755585 RepID=UPI0015FFA488|nr:toll/interleukin-1 receptor domain-containing protein [Rhodopirellula sp. JC639]
MDDHSQVFVSHAVKDEELVEDFVDLLQVGIGIQPGQIFCSSLPGMGIPAGKSFVDYIKSQVLTPSMVLLVVSPQFLKSHFCQNEVGASWGLSLPIFPLLVPPVDYADVGGVLAGVQLAKLDNKEDLNDLRDDVIRRLGLSPYSTSHWERKRDRFLNKLAIHLEAGESTTTLGTQPAKGSATVRSTGNWMKLGDSYYEVSRFERRGSSSIHVDIQAKTVEQEMTLQQVRPSAEEYVFQEVCEYSYQNDGGHVRIVNVSSINREGESVWSLELVLEEDRESSQQDFAFHSGDHEYTARDIAELRAGRLLVNTPPPPSQFSRGTNERFLESIISGNSSGSPLVNTCVIRDTLQRHATETELRLIFARLEAVFALKTSGIVGTVMELEIGPIDRNGVMVRFRGIRPARNRHEHPEEILVVGTCALDG